MDCDKIVIVRYFYNLFYKRSHRFVESLMKTDWEIRERTITNCTKRLKELSKNDLIYLC